MDGGGYEERLETNLALGEAMIPHESIAQLKGRMAESIIGQETVIERLLIALLANGNVLMEGLPGLAKTRTIKTLVRSRNQCPDESPGCRCEPGVERSVRSPAATACRDESELGWTRTGAGTEDAAASVDSLETRLGKRCARAAESKVASVASPPVPRGQTLDQGPILIQPAIWHSGCHGE